MRPSPDPSSSISSSAASPLDSGSQLQPLSECQQNAQQLPNESPSAFAGVDSDESSGQASGRLAAAAASNSAATVALPTPPHGLAKPSTVSSFLQRHNGDSFELTEGGPQPDDHHNPALFGAGGFRTGNGVLYGDNDTTLDDSRSIGGRSLSASVSGFPSLTLGANGAGNAAVSFGDHRRRSIADADDVHSEHSFGSLDPNSSTFADKIRSMASGLLGSTLAVPPTTAHASKLANMTTDERIALVRNEAVAAMQASDEAKVDCVEAFQQHAKLREALIRQVTAASVIFSEIEKKRVAELSDNLRKYAVFISSLHANLQYDVQRLSGKVELIADVSATTLTALSAFAPPDPAALAAAQALDTPLFSSMLFTPASIAGASANSAASFSGSAAVRRPSFGIDLGPSRAGGSAGPGLDRSLSIRSSFYGASVPAAAAGSSTGGAGALDSPGSGPGVLSMMSSPIDKQSLTRMGSRVMSALPSMSVSSLLAGEGKGSTGGGGGVSGSSNGDGASGSYPALSVSSPQSLPEPQSASSAFQHSSTASSSSFGITNEAFAGHTGSGSGLRSMSGSSSALTNNSSSVGGAAAPGTSTSASGSSSLLSMGRFFGSNGSGSGGNGSLPSSASAAIGGNHSGKVSTTKPLHSSPLAPKPSASAASASAAQAQHSDEPSDGGGGAHGGSSGGGGSGGWQNRVLGSLGLGRFGGSSSNAPTSSLAAGNASIGGVGAGGSSHPPIHPPSSKGSAGNNSSSKGSDGGGGAAGGGAGAGMSVSVSLLGSVRNQGSTGAGAKGAREAAAMMEVLHIQRGPIEFLVDALFDPEGTVIKLGADGQSIIVDIQQQQSGGFARDSSVSNGMEGAEDTDDGQGEQDETPIPSLSLADFASGKSTPTQQQHNVTSPQSGRSRVGTTTSIGRDTSSSIGHAGEHANDLRDSSSSTPRQRADNVADGDATTAAAASPVPGAPSPVPDGFTGPHLFTPPPKSQRGAAHQRRLSAVIACGELNPCVTVLLSQVRRVLKSAPDGLARFVMGMDAKRGEGTVLTRPSFDALTAVMLIALDVAAERSDFQRARALMVISQTFYCYVQSRSDEEASSMAVDPAIAAAVGTPRLVGLEGAQGGESTASFSLSPPRLSHPAPAADDDKSIMSSPPDAAIAGGQQAASASASSSSSASSSGAGGGGGRARRLYLQIRVKNHPLWQDMQYWESAVYDSVGAEMKKGDPLPGGAGSGGGGSKLGIAAMKGIAMGHLLAGESKGVPGVSSSSSSSSSSSGGGGSSKADRMEREREAEVIFGQLGFFAYNMVAFGVPHERLVKRMHVAGCRCSQVYDLSRWDACVHGAPPPTPTNPRSFSSS